MYLRFGSIVPEALLQTALGFQPKVSIIPTNITSRSDDMWAESYNNVRRLIHISDSQYELLPMSTHSGILIHVVFSTKQRFKLLNKTWRSDLFGVIGGNAQTHKGVLLQAGGIEDHVHLLLKTHPSFAIADTIKLIKGNSSHWINQNRKTSSKFSWQRGYGAFSVSESMTDVVKRYIENQEQHHLKQSFRDEYLEFLRKHRIEFDQRYVFEDEHFG